MDSDKARLRHALRPPTVAWPTLALFCGALVLWAFALLLPGQGLGSTLWKMTLIVIALQALFTVMHDAAHKAISRSSWLNEALGRVCGTLFLRAFVGFRFAHQRHHKHTNDPAEDPDVWSGQGPRWLLPWRWLTQDSVYRKLYRAHWAERPLSERREVVLTTTLECLLIIGLVAAGYGKEVLLFWVIPAKLSLALLAFVIDYLPHRPHRVAAKQSRFKTTRVRPSWFLALVTFHQNLHGVHHVYPSAPFYRYGTIWRLQRKTLVSRGMQVDRPSATITGILRRLGRLGAEENVQGARVTGPDRAAPWGDANPCEFEARTLSPNHLTPSSPRTCADIPHQAISPGEGLRAAGRR